MNFRTTTSTVLIASAFVFSIAGCSKTSTTDPVGSGSSSSTTSTTTPAAPMGGSTTTTDTTTPGSMGASSPDMAASGSAMTGPASAASAP